MASSKGIGYRLNSFTTTYNITGAMTLILIIMVLMTLLNAVMNKFESKLLRWRPSFKRSRAFGTSLISKQLWTPSTPRYPPWEFTASHSSPR